MAKPKPVKRCKACGVHEKKDALGYSNITTFLGYCINCINRALRACDEPRKDSNGLTAKDWGVEDPRKG